MSRLSYLLFLVIIASCIEPRPELPRTTFDSPFPKRNIDLTGVLGEKLALKTSTGIRFLSIKYNGEENLVIDTGILDTIFKGQVCRFRGLYFFNQQVDDSSFFIYAIRCEDSLVYGLLTPWEQMQIVENFVESGQYPKLVRSKLPNRIRLHPEKKEMKKLYYAVLDSITPDTIFRLQNSTGISATMPEATDPEEYEIISRIYPNPAKDYLEVELLREGRYTYKLSDRAGRKIMDGVFTSTKNKLNVSSLNVGVYILSIAGDNTDAFETISVSIAR